MGSHQDQIEVVRTWLSHEFDSAPIEVVELSHEDAILFRIRDRAKGPYPELEIAEEAWDDLGAQ